MSKEMKTWKKPKLIVLGRGRPEEMTLATCKGSIITSAPGPNTKVCADAPDACQSTAPS